MDYLFARLVGTPVPAPESTEEELNDAADDAAIAAHVATCTVDGFCYICQCL